MLAMPGIRLHATLRTAAPPLLMLTRMLHYTAAPPLLMLLLLLLSLSPPPLPIMQGLS